MSLFILEKRRQIEGKYKKLRNIRERIQNLLETSSSDAYLDNLRFLEYEEEALLTNIVKMKSSF